MEVPAASVPAQKLDESDYCNGISFVELVNRWRTKRSTVHTFRELKSVNIASIVSFFAETDDLQYPLLHLFSEYRRLLEYHKFRSTRHARHPKLFLESYNGRQVSSMRQPMLVQNFESEIRSANSWHSYYALFPFPWFQHSKEQLDGLIEDLLDVLQGTTMHRVEYVMRFITMLTMSGETTFY